MSYSILNNKYQKWTNLLADEPDNAEYKHKVHKYTSLLKKTHVGGNSQKSNVDELLDKIDNAIKKQMDGGSGSKITGYRNMKGGAVGSSCPFADCDGKCDEYGYCNKNHNCSIISLQNELANAQNIISNFIKQLKQEKTEKETYITRLQEEIATEKKNIEQLKLEHTNELIKAEEKIPEANLQELEKLKKEIKDKTTELQTKEKSLQDKQEELAKLTHEKTLCDTKLIELEQKLKTNSNEIDNATNQVLELPTKVGIVSDNLPQSSAASLKTGGGKYRHSKRYH
jgi:hypothetical protein